MDLLELLKILFCCMFPVRRRGHKTRVSAPLRRVRRPRAVVMRGADKHRRIVWLRSRANYADLRHRVLRSISRDISNTVVAWCPSAVLANDYVATLLNRYGEVLAYVDSWSEERGLAMWAGTVVQYSRPEEAELALREIPMACRHIKILPLERVLCMLVDCELMYGDHGRSFSTVLVSGRRSPRGDGSFSLLLDMSSYGAIERLFFSYRSSPGVVCEVSYPFLTHAYLAAIMLEGTIYDSVTLSAKIDCDSREEEIIEEAKKYLMFTTESQFPR